jgi:hypothetical protein
MTFVSNLLRVTLRAGEDALDNCLAGGATTFYLLQKGREVRLKPGDKVDIELGR